MRKRAKHGRKKSALEPFREVVAGAAAEPPPRAGLSPLGVPGVPWHPQNLADQLTLSQPRGADYAHQITLATPDFQTFRRPCH